MKFGRQWKMVVQGNTQLWTFGSPFTLRMSVNAFGTPTPTQGEFFIYNLPEKVRKDILMDIYQQDKNDTPLFRKISLVAGYSNQNVGPVSPPIMAPVFVGNVFWAYSYREGPNWITHIHCADGQGAIDVASIDQTLDGSVGGVELGQVYRVLCQALVGVGRDVTGFFISSDFDSILEPRTRTLSGNPWEILIQDVLPRNAELFINQGKIYIIVQGEYVQNPSGLTEINADSGLIGSPRRQQALTVAMMVFEPRLQIGQKVTLKSLTGSDETMLLSVKHFGTISEAECGDLITEATFLRFPGLTQAVAA